MTGLGLGVILSGACSEHYHHVAWARRSSHEMNVNFPFTQSMTHYFFLSAFTEYLLRAGPVLDGGGTAVMKANGSCSCVTLSIGTVRQETCKQISHVLSNTG